MRFLTSFGMTRFMVVVRERGIGCAKRIQSLSPITKKLIVILNKTK